MQKSRFPDSQIIAVLKQAKAGTPVPELCREHGISSATFLQVALHIRWQGRFHDSRMRRAGGREPTPEEDVCRVADEGRDRQGSDGKKSGEAISAERWADGQLKPRRQHSTGLCRLHDQPDLLSLPVQSVWRKRTDCRLVGAVDIQPEELGLRLCFPHLRNVKGNGWNHKRVNRIYRALELNCGSSRLTDHATAGLRPPQRSLDAQITLIVDTGIANHYHLHILKARSTTDRKRPNRRICLPPYP